MPRGFSYHDEAVTQGRIWTPRDMAVSGRIIRYYDTSKPKNITFSNDEIDEVDGLARAGTSLDVTAAGYKPYRPRNIGVGLGPQDYIHGQNIVPGYGYTHYFMVGFWVENLDLGSSDTRDILAQGSTDTNSSNDNQMISLGLKRVGASYLPAIGTRNLNYYAYDSSAPPIASHRFYHLSGFVTKGPSSPAISPGNCELRLDGKKLNVDTTFGFVNSDFTHFEVTGLGFNARTQSVQPHDIIVYYAIIFNSTLPRDHERELVEGWGAWNLWPYSAGLVDALYPGHPFRLRPPLTGD